MDHGLSPQERERYREQGFLVRERVFAEPELEALRGAVERVHARVVEAARVSNAPVERIDGKRYQPLLGSLVKWEWREDAAEIRSMEPFLHLDPALDPLVDDARLVEPVAALLGESKLSLFTDKLNFKRPGGAPFPWHQDSPYWAFGCNHLERLASLQLYLDDADPESGCLWMIDLVSSEVLVKTQSNQTPTSSCSALAELPHRSSCHRTSQAFRSARPRHLCSVRTV